MKMIVSGATGFVGRAVVAELVENGDQITLLIRCGSGDNEGSSKITIDDFLANPTLADEYDAFIHLAGLAHGKSLGQGTLEEEMYAVNTQLTADLAEAVFRHSAARFVFLSSMAVYGKDSSAQAITEESELAAQTPYGQSKLEAEKAVSALASVYAGNYVVVRPPLVYGANAPANFGLLNRLAQTPIPLPFAHATAKRSNIGVRNLAAFLRVVAEHPAARNQTFVIADDEPDSLLALITALRNGEGRSLPVPISFLEAGLRIIGKRKMAQQLFAPLSIDWTKARRELGWQPIYSFDQNMSPVKDL